MNTALKWTASITVLIIFILAWQTYPPETPYVLENSDIEIETALAVPPKDADHATRSAYLTLVASLAVQAEEVVIKSCKPSPAVILINVGDKIVFRSEDSESRTLFFGEEYPYKLTAFARTEITTDFASRPGIYRFNCDGLEDPVGIVFVSPK